MPDTQTITQTHPLYDAWSAQWELLGEAYEGDGRFSDGRALVAHPRELITQIDAEGNATLVPGETIKFRRRKALARYENYAQIIVDTMVAYQYAKGISRSVGDSADHPLADWWQDVDGLGTQIDVWLEQQQTLAHVYGHVWVLMDLTPLAAPARSKAEQARPVLRVYTPLDVLDWLIDADGTLRAVKVCEVVGRTSILEPLPKTPTYEYRVWTEADWTLYDEKGQVRDSGAHPFGVVPCVVFRSRKRARIPVIGRSLLGDAKQHQDLYNLTSELRALLRDQTFSIIHVGLADDETPEQARANLGTHVATDMVMFSHRGVEFIAPADGPAAVYERAIDHLARAIYRQAALPWEGDSRDAESADSRRLKALDLNRLLANHADEAERVDYELAKLWCMASAGSHLEGLRAYEQASVTIRHPDEFAVEDVQATVLDAQAALGLRLGPRADTLIRQRTVPILLPDVSAEDAEQIAKDIEATPADGARGVEQASSRFRDSLSQSLAAMPELAA